MRPVNLCNLPAFNLCIALGCQIVPGFVPTCVRITAEDNPIKQTCAIICRELEDLGF